MPSHAEEFVRNAAGVSAATSDREGEYVHVYRGELADVAGRVRFLTLAPGLDDEAVRKQFVRAAGKWGNADTHPNIVSVYASGDEPRPWIAVDDVGGQPLDAVQSSLTPSERKAVVLDVGEALRNAALYNTFHQDLRPDRVRVVPDDGSVSAFVDEWGLERAVRAAAGAPDPTLFAAPEAVADSGSIDERTDVYGLGAVAYYALTGRPPVAGGPDVGQAVSDGDVTPPSDVDGSLPTAVDDVVLRALSTDPAERYDSAYAFTRAFDSAYAIPGEDRTTADDNVAAAGGAASAADVAETDGETDDDGSFLTGRRAALGMLSIGVLGLGMGLQTAESGDEDDSVNPDALYSDTPLPTPTEVLRPTATDTPTEAATTDAAFETSLTAQRGVAYRDGVVFVVDDGTVKAFDTESETVTNEFTVPEGSRPRGLAVGAGSLWFADRVGPDYDGAVAELDPASGTVRSMIRSRWDPRGLAFGDGSLWTVDITANRIVEYSPAGDVVSSFGTPGVSWGLGLAYFDGSLWLGTDCSGDGCTVSLREYSTDGELRRETGRRTEVGYGGLAATETELLGPGPDGTLTVLETD
jgi:hypothetical protein